MACSAMAQSGMQVFLNEWMVMVPGYLKVQEGPPQMANGRKEDSDLTSAHALC